MNEKLKNVLDMAEAFERTGVSFYTEYSSKVKPKLVKETFKWLADMEREHVEFIKALKRSLPEGREVSFSIEDKSKTFMEKLTAQKLVPESLDGDLADVSVLRMALLIEKDFESFYLRNAEQAEDDEAKRILNTLALWEKGHVQIISELITSLLDRLRIDTGFYPVDF
ncbi:MAG: hypothetical protein PWP09_1298 [Thermotogota bacterium]|nr:hypothetical protein [Thermotogota bacterium]